MLTFPNTGKDNNKVRAIITATFSFRVSVFISIMLMFVPNHSMVLWTRAYRPQMTRISGWSHRHVHVSSGQIFPTRRQHSPSSWRSRPSPGADIFCSPWHRDTTRRSLSTALLAVTITKSSSSSTKKRAAKFTSNSKWSNYSLVVHGPPGFHHPLSSSKQRTPSSQQQQQQQGRPFRLVVVESPSKCQTIATILHAYTTEHQLPYDFVVTSSMGHVRNVPRTKQHPDEVVAGIDIDHHYQPTYTIIPGKEKLVQDLQHLAQDAQQLVLATDDDREGEAMAWHLLELLQNNNHDIHHHDNKNQQPQPPYVRVRFTEITPNAIVEAISNPEPSLRLNLVQAQETRRVLDRLAGFTVSPVLWKKIAPGLSAGRVQSVGMALIVQRERERMVFQQTEYWSVQGNFTSPTEDIDEVGQDRLLEATLVSINGQTLASGTADFDPRQSNQLAESSIHKLHLQASDAASLIRRIQQEGDSWTWTVQSVTSSKREQKPPIPFITSSLQQESNRRLGLSVSDTMRAAQQLYEGGFISYMRTDSTHLSNDAKSAIRSEIVADFGGPNKYIAWMGDRNNKKQTASGSNNNNNNKSHKRPTKRFAQPSKTVVVSRNLVTYLPSLMVLPETYINWSIKEQLRLICHHKFQIRLP
jgi:DNA topoisomerase IA